MSISLKLVAGGLVLAAIGLGSALWVKSARREFAGPTTITMGIVLKKGKLLGSRRRSSELFCWVSYEFTTPDGRTRRNWGLWGPGCGSSPGRPVPVQYRVDYPDVNRPAGSEPWFPSELFFFAAGVAFVVAFMLRDTSGVPDAIP